MQNLKYRWKLGLLIGVELAVAIGFYFSCLARGSCTGQCIAVGYDVGSVCFMIALKLFAAMFGATLVGVIFWRHTRS